MQFTNKMILLSLLTFFQLRGRITVRCGIKWNLIYFKILSIILTSSIHRGTVCFFGLIHFIKWLQLPVLLLR
jgi:hypothetical protein